MQKSKLPPSLARSDSRLPSARGSLFREAPAWAFAPEGWRTLYGGFYDLGVSIEWHDFKSTTPFEWSRSFHPRSLELCLNLSGRGRVESSTSAMDFEARSAGFYCPENGELKASRRAGEHH